MVNKSTTSCPLGGIHPPLPEERPPPASQDQDLKIPNDWAQNEPNSHRSWFSPNPFLPTSRCPFNADDGRRCQCFLPWPFFHRHSFIVHRHSFVVHCHLFIIYCHSYITDFGIIATLFLCLVKKMSKRKNKYYSQCILHSERPVSIQEFWGAACPSPSSVNFSLRINHFKTKKLLN